MQLGECTAVPQNTHPPACPSRYLVLAFKIFLAPIRAQHMASRLQPDKPRGYRFHARTAHHSHRRRHPLLQPRQHQLLQHHPHALPCPKKSLWHAPPVRPRCAPTSPALPTLPFLKPQLPTAAFTKSTIVPKVTRRETVDVEPTPFFVSILRPYWTVLFCSESGYLLQGSHWSRSSCGRPSVGRSSERRFSGTYTRW